MKVNQITTLANIPDRAITKTTKFFRSEKFLSRMKSDPDFFKSFMFGTMFLQIALTSVVFATASWFNKKIPKEERKLAAAMDLTDGLYTIGLTYPVFLFTYNRWKKWSGKLFKKISNNPSRLNTSMQGFSLIMNVFLFTILFQNVVVPILSTPTAKWFKEKYLDKLSNNPLKLKQKTHSLPQEKKNAGIFHNF